mmetsp:Transcript_97110/g.231074  ORF Transcript_97110/g.231074 Transcript_97110/m.231074 type:complete len:313 (-) Transcript_97110:215-1153(-)
MRWALSALACLACLVNAQDVRRESWYILKVFHSYMMNPFAEEVSAGTKREPLQIIGAGLGRTGTSSMAMALTRLGYRPYHWVEGMMQMGHTGLWARWYDAMHSGDEAGADAAFQTVAEAIAQSGFNATLDFPACMAFESFMKMYPNAKVLLSVRSSGQAWAASILNGVIDLSWAAQFGFFGLTQRLRDLRTVILGGWPLLGIPPMGPGDLPDGPILEKVHDDWARRVKRAVPKEKLLVFEAKDGYGPLCRFLDISDADCPKEPYPHMNANVDSWWARRFGWFTVTCWIPNTMILLCAPFYCCWRCRRKQKAA